MDEQAVRKRMWFQTSVDFIRKCELFSILDQVVDGSGHTHLAA